MPSAQSIPLKQRTVIGLSITLAVASYFIPQPEQSYQSPLLSPATASSGQRSQQHPGNQPELPAKPATSPTTVVQIASRNATPVSNSDKYLATAPADVKLVPDSSTPSRDPIIPAPVPGPTAAPTVVFSQDMFNSPGPNAQASQSRFLPISQPDLAK